MGNRIDEFIILKPMGFAELEEILGSLKKGAPGYGGVGKDILFLSLPFISHSLFHIKKFPLTLWQAIKKVPPPLWTGGKQVPKNYHPQDLIMWFP